MIERVSDVFLFLLLVYIAGQITTTQGFGKFSFQFNVANYIELLKTVYVKWCVQAKAKTKSNQKDKTVLLLFISN